MSKTREEAEAIYAGWDRDVERLEAQPVIVQDDLVGLARDVRCVVAEVLWAKCSAGARTALLHDDHRYVRAHAEISARNEF